MKYLKDNLKNFLDRRAKLQKSGAAASQLPTCAFFEEMRFLHDRTSNLHTESNVPSTLPLHQPAVVPQFGNQEHSPINPPKKCKAEQEVIMQDKTLIVLLHQTEMNSIVKIFYFAKVWYLLCRPYDERCAHAHAHTHLNSPGCVIYSTCSSGFSPLVKSLFFCLKEN